MAIATAFMFIIMYRAVLGCRGSDWTSIIAFTILARPLSDRVNHVSNNPLLLTLKPLIAFVSWN
jgi:hypothetical protein